MKMLEQALIYRSKGFSVIPIAGTRYAKGKSEEEKIDSSKKPLVSWSKYQKELPTEEEITSWWTTYPEANIGIITGSISGIAVIDMDTPEAVEYGKKNFPKTPTVKTGKGAHAYFQYREGVRNQQNKKELPGIDIRGEGGYVVAPPSVHYSGNKYTWAEGLGLDVVPMAEFPDLIMQSLGISTPYSNVLQFEKLDETDKTDETDMLSKKDYFWGGVSEGGRNNAMAQFAGDLFQKGMSFEEVLHLCGLQNQSYKPPMDDKEVFNVVKSIQKTDQRKKQENIHSILDETDKTDEMDMLSIQGDRCIIPVTNFPLDIFPKEFKEAALTISEAMNVDVGFVASSMLTLMSGAIGNIIRVSPKAGWNVPPFLWLIRIADSGDGKTPLINELMRPIRKKQAEAFEEHEQELEAYAILVQKAKKNKEELTLKKPEVVDHYISDFTIESLRKVFKNNHRGVIAHVDEIGGLIKSFNQYKRGGNDEQKYTELFNCDSWKINRQGMDIFIPNTGVAIIGGIPPRTMPEIFKFSFFENGLLPRFLPYTGQKISKSFSYKGITKDSSEYWDRLLKWCYKMPLTDNEHGFVNYDLLTFEGSARSLWGSFHDEYYALQPYLSDRAGVFIPKLITYSLKLAGVLHCLESFTNGVEPSKIPSTINKNTVEKAIEVTRFFMGQIILMSRLYDPQKKRINEFQKKLIETLYTLQDEVKNGRLPLARIVEAYNRSLPENLAQPSKSVSNLIKELGLSTVKIGSYHLTWEEGKLKKLFLENMSVSSTTSVSSVSGTHEMVSENKSDIESMSISSVSSHSDSQKAAQEQQDDGIPSPIVNEVQPSENSVQKATEGEPSENPITKEEPSMSRWEAYVEMKEREFIGDGDRLGRHKPRTREREVSRRIYAPEKNLDAETEPSPTYLRVKEIYQKRREEEETEDAEVKHLLEERMDVHPSSNVIDEVKTEKPKTERRPLTPKEMKEVEYMGEHQFWVRDALRKKAAEKDKAEKEKAMVESAESPKIEQPNNAKEEKKMHYVPKPLVLKP